MSTRAVRTAVTDQNRVDFRLRDRFHPAVPILGGSIPIFLVNMCTGARPACGRLEFLEEFHERFLELFGRSGVRMLHVGCYGSVSLTSHTRTGAMRTRWPRPFAQETDKRTVYGGQPCGWVHVARIVVYVYLQRSTNPRLRHRRLHLPATAKTE